MTKGQCMDETSTKRNVDEMETKRDEVSQPYKTAGKVIVL
jgi:hypothetical protein